MIRKDPERGDGEDSNSEFPKCSAIIGEVCSGFPKVSLSNRDAPRGLGDAVRCVEYPKFSVSNKDAVGGLGDAVRSVRCVEDSDGTNNCVSDAFVAQSNCSASGEFGREREGNHGTKLRDGEFRGHSVVTPTTSEKAASAHVVSGVESTFDLRGAACEAIPKARKDGTMGSTTDSAIATCHTCAVTDRVPVDWSMVSTSWLSCATLEAAAAHVAASRRATSKRQSGGAFKVFVGEESCVATAEEEKNGMAFKGSVRGGKSVAAAD